MVLVWHKFNWKEVTSYFPRWLLRSLQCGRRKWLKSWCYTGSYPVIVTATINKYVLCYDYHVSLMFTRSWFHFVMRKKEKGRVSSQKNSGRENWFLPLESPTLFMYPLLTLFWHTLIFFFFSPGVQSLFIYLKHLYWSIIALQWCVDFCFITKWISYAYTYIPISPPSCVSLPPSLSHPSRWSQSPKLISLCYAAASH